MCKKQTLMDKDLKDERNNKRWDKTSKMPFRKSIRLHEATLFMKSEVGLKVEAALCAALYGRNSNSHFEKIWDQISKQSS